MAKKSDFVPDPTAIGGSLDTSGTAQGGDYEDPTALHDVFDEKHVEKAEQLAAERAVTTDAMAAEEASHAATAAPSVVETSMGLVAVEEDKKGDDKPSSAVKMTAAQKKAIADRRKATAKKAAKKAPAKKAAAKKAPAKKAPAKKTAAKKAAPAKRAAASKTAAKTGSQKRAARKES